MSEDPQHPSFQTLFGGCTTSAVHLEMRDDYTPDDPVFIDWKAGVPIDPRARWGEWYDLMSATTARGITVRRARIVSEREIAMYAKRFAEFAAAAVYGPETRGLVIGALQALAGDAGPAPSR